jgi:hypothetical protein
MAQIIGLTLLLLACLPAATGPAAPKVNNSSKQQQKPKLEKFFIFHS